VSEQRPERGGAWDFPGQVRPEYAPNRDGEPDPGEIVWVWVPYEEDPTQGKDRPVVIVGRSVDDSELLVGLMLSSKDHDGDEHWHRIGAGSWDGEHRPSWVRVDRPLAVTPESVRREGAALDATMFLAVVEHAAGLRDRVPARHSLPTVAGGARAVSRLVGVYRANGGPLGEVAYVLGKLLGRAHCSLCDVTHSPVRRKAEWNRMTAALGVPFDLVHVNQVTGELKALVPSKDVAPAVLAEVSGRLEVVLTAGEIEPLSGSVVAFERALTRSLRQRSLALR
jgi:hypothetical protein